MYKFNILLFFLVFGITCFVKSQQPEVLYEDKVEEADAAQSLQPIPPGKALPLVLLRNRFQKLLLPVNLHKVILLDKKMIQGTDFAHPMKISTQVFYCPKSNTEKCLIETPFNDNEFLQCASDPIPIFVKEPGEIECGRSKIDFFYKFVYQLCKGEDQIDTEVVPFFYRYCYDTNNQKTKFTVHTIKSPKLLTAKLLLKEREVTYPIMMKNGTTVSIDLQSDDVDSTSKLISPKQGYQWRKLVPSEDMALASWRKTTFHEINLALQHEKLIEIWNNIGENVRSNAIEIYKKDHLYTVIYTGVFELESTTETGNNDQLLNMWVKLIMAKKAISQADQGVAILMNNFIDTGTNHSTLANSKEIEEYCNQNICLESLKDEYKNLNESVRCCLVTPKILDLFNIEHIKLDELYIPKVTFGEDQVYYMRRELLLKDKMDTKTKEQIDELFCKIQPNEILPLILHWNQKTQEISIPQKIQQIVTKDKRIVDGSKFFEKNQLFFCPKETSNETCLEPRNFDRFKPLQCTKLPVPSVKHVLIDNEQQILCGAENKGFLYKVFYELCPDVLPEYKAPDSPDTVLYEFCYDSTQQTILYARHKILSEDLLKTAPLFWEREVEFQMPTDSQLPLSNLKELQEAAKEERENSASPTETKKSLYKLQKLVPSEDMAFASWKLSTYLLVNTALQHESLISLWKEINYYTQNQIVSRPYIWTKRHEIASINLIYDGALDLPTTISEVDFGADQKSQIWFKIIHKKPKSPNHDIEEGVVILMENFLVTETKRPTILQQYCEKSLCLNEFQSKFTEIGGRVWCCPLTIKLAKYFGIPDVNSDNMVSCIDKVIQCT